MEINVDELKKSFKTAVIIGFAMMTYERLFLPQQWTVV